MSPQMRTEALDRGRGTTRDRILAAASELFSRVGFDATTVKDIAREAQLTDPALYYYFESKRDILAALLLESPPVVDVHFSSHATPTRDALIDDLCRVFDFWSDHADILRLLYSHSLDGDDPTRALGEQLRLACEQLIMPPVTEIYGNGAQRIYDSLRSLMVGVQLDALIEFGAGYELRVAAPEFRSRLRRLISAALP
jgi:AcrR family transcriptional regulator